jgi:hypothetical protein
MRTQITSLRDVVKKAIKVTGISTATITIGEPYEFF